VQQDLETVGGDSGAQSRIELEGFGTTHYIDGDTDMVVGSN
jgi:hypothetical protein